VARRHEVSPAQVVLRWHIEHRVVVIPRSSNPKRIDENFDLWGWSLTSDEVALLDRLSPKTA
jgi:diketogulonate reductase-like aldo/keto reductase